MNDNLLMWGHYGGKYGGFCLEFRTECEAFHKFHKVTYDDRTPEISLIPFICDGDACQLIEKAYCTKSSSWAYEREWRAIHKTVGTLYAYPAEALKAVYFGPNIDRQGLEIICLILAGQNTGVELRQGKRSDDEFKILFEPFTYTSFVEGKRLGLI